LIGTFPFILWVVQVEIRVEVPAVELQDGPSADFDTNLFKEFDLGWRAAHMHF
jgi:hypothetical protein